MSRLIRRWLLINNRFAFIFLSLNESMLNTLIIARDTTNMTANVTNICIHLCSYPRFKIYLSQHFACNTLAESVLWQNRSRSRSSARVTINVQFPRGNLRAAKRSRSIIVDKHARVSFAAPVSELNDYWQAGQLPLRRRTDTPQRSRFDGPRSTADDL